jgi:hypothetical protein
MPVMESSHATLYQRYICGEFSATFFAPRKMVPLLRNVDSRFLKARKVSPKLDFWAVFGLVRLGQLHWP